MENKKLWFKAKKIGWGWTPETWEGWAVTAIYCFSVAGISFLYLNKMQDVVAYESILQALLIWFVSFAVLTAGLIFVCFKFGENPGKFKLWK